jgi:hypothetical protein
MTRIWYGILLEVQTINSYTFWTSNCGRVGLVVYPRKTTVVIRDIPAQICTTCGEEYVDAVTGKRLSQIAETAVNEGI